MKLSPVDILILESYIDVVRDLANYLGSSFEIVLHSLEDYEHSVIAIVHGEHTGREVGAPITDRALAMLGHLTEGEPATAYFSTNPSGEPMKSTTIPVRGEQGRIIGLLCINRYLNTPLIDFVRELSPSAGYVPASRGLEEHFASNTDELVLTMLERVRAAVMDDESVLPSNRNKVIVERLFREGIFQLKDAVALISEHLGVSKNTVYMHLRTCRKQARETDTK